MYMNTIVYTLKKLTILIFYSLNNIPIYETLSCISKDKYVGDTPVYALTHYLGENRLGFMISSGLELKIKRTWNYSIKDFRNVILPLTCTKILILSKSWFVFVLSVLIPDYCPLIL